MDLSQYGITTDSNAGNLNIPGLGDIQSLLGSITLISIIIGGLFFVLYLINVIQRMRADRAMIAIHKDISAIRTLLERQTESHPVSTTADQPVRSTPLQGEPEPTPVPTEVGPIQ